MTVPTHVVIPTRDRLDLCAELTTELILQYEFDHMWVFDNSDAQDAADHLMLDQRLHVVPARGWGIYGMWNYGWKKALDETRGIMSDTNAPLNLAILNDDIKVPDGFLSLLARPLRLPENDDVWCVYPDYNASLEDWDDYAEWIPDQLNRTGNATFRKGGMCGWAFMLKGEKHFTDDLPFVDEQFEWWCGDDDLAQQIVKCGGEIARVDGLPLDHVSEATARLHPELHAAKSRDIERFRSKYGSF